MKKPRNVIVPINPKLERYLEVLQRSGFFGCSVEEVCERLIFQGVERIVMGAESNPLSAQLCEILKSE